MNRTHVPCIEIILGIVILLYIIILITTCTVMPTIILKAGTYKTVRIINNNKVPCVEIWSKYQLQC